VIGNIFLPMRAKIRQRAISKTYQDGSGFFNFLDQILSCQMCCSVWVGWFMGIFIWSPSLNYLETPHLFSWFFDGGMASGFVYTYVMIIDKIQNYGKHE
jgi:hypothetical protein